MDAHPEGAKAVAVDVPLKPSWFATIKTCNYLPNAMMKRAAAAAGADIPVAFDERGFLAEGATENLGIVTREGQLRLPKPDRILSGITVQRAADLAQELVRDGRLAAVENADIDRDAVARAAEVLVFGTTPDVTAVTRFDGKPVGDGRPGSVQSALNWLLTADIRTNAAWRTPVWG
jgi:branched-chain amino acid aminotransferase